MSITPKKLAIYFGFPSLINGAGGNVTVAVNAFKVYDQVIFGKGLEITSHPDHTKTASIISQLNALGVKVYGEVECTNTLANIKQSVNKWQTIGAHIYCNKIGYDFGVTRSMQNQIINYIHGKSLQAMVNPWDPNDIFSNAVVPTYNPTGVASAINSNDWYLAVSYQIINGAYQTVSDWATKAVKMANFKQTFGTKMACATSYDSGVFNQSKMDYAYFSTILYGFDSFGWGEENYSATSNLLPFRTRKTFYGTKFAGNVTNTSGVYERKTNVGIHIDTTAHTVNFLLN